MSDPRQAAEPSVTLPEARIRNRRWFPSIVWLLPAVAAIVTGILVYGRIEDLGPSITIRFKDGSGIRTGQTPIKYRGVPIGEVTSVDLSGDQQEVLVRARLERSAAPIASEQSVFWIVRPEVEIGSITGLGTVISGPEIQVLPGTGGPRSEFVGLDRAPVAFEGRGLRIVLRTARPGPLRRNSPVYYRGVEVGVVHDVTLGDDTAMAEIRVLIRPRYANLVRSGSVFWNVSGARVNAGLFNGVEIQVESLRALLAGGIAFASPHGPDTMPVKDGTVFALYPGARKEWLLWAPRIELPADDRFAEPQPGEASSQPRRPGRERSQAGSPHYAAGARGGRTSVAISAAHSDISANTTKPVP